MDQMISNLQTICARKKTFTQEELTAIASYLVGQIPLRKVEKYLPKGLNVGYMYGYTNDTAEILQICKAEPALLPRLGRFLLLIEYMDTQLYGRMVYHACDAGILTPWQILVDSGLGVQRLLWYLFNHGHTVQNGTFALLERLEQEAPEELVEYIKTSGPESQLRPLAYLCAKWDCDLLSGKEPAVEDKKLRRAGKDLSALLGESLMLSLAVTMEHWRGNARDRCRESLEQHCPAMVAVWDKVQPSLKRVPGDRKEYYESSLFFALVLTQFKLEGVNAVARAMFQVNPHQFLTALVRAMYQDQEGKFICDIRLAYAGDARRFGGSDEEQEADMLAQLELLGDWLERMGISPSHLCPWAISKLLYLPSRWSGVFDKAYGSDQAAMEAALPLSGGAAKVYLHRRIRQLGGTLPVEECEELASQSLLGMTQGKVKRADAEQLLHWLRTGEGKMEDLPSMEAHYKYAPSYHSLRAPYCDFELAVFLLLGDSPMAERLLDFLSARADGMYLGLFCNFYGGVMGGDAADAASWLLKTTQVELGVRSLADYVCKGYGIGEFPRQVLEGMAAQRPESFAAAMASKEADADTRLLLLELIYGKGGDYDPDFLISCLGDKSKKVRQLAGSYLLPKRELADKVRPLLEAKKKDLREAAEQLMVAYEGEGSAAAAGAADLVGFCARSMPKNAMASLRWAFPGELPPVRWADGDAPADSMVVQCYLYLVLTSKSMDLSPSVQSVRQALNNDDLRAAARQVYQQWTADGAPAKYKSALLLYALHGDDSDVLALQRQIDEWAQHSRGAIAAEAVRAMALGGSDLALMTVDNIGRKFKNKQVRRAGQEAFAAAAKALNTTPEALGDRIIPTLGFDARGERTIDYGQRQFTAILSPSLTIELKDGLGKTIKSLPKPGAKDDVDLAERSKAEFTALKKSLKAVVTTQSQRLEQALATGRRWTTDAWKKLFVENPIMHSFATGLVWGLYEEDNLTDSFRYMEDGSFTNVDEDDFDFDGIASGDIGLVHPLDLDDDSLSQWIGQLADYEVQQPIQQLERPVYHIEEEERDMLTIDRFGGKQMLGITLVGKLQKSGWYKGSVQDAGCFYNFYKEIGNIGVQLYFSGMYVSPDPSESIVIGQAGFYRAGSVQRGSYVYDDVKREEIIPLKEIPERLFSEVVLDLTVATASSTGLNEGWKSEGGLQFFNGK